MQEIEEKVQNYQSRLEAFERNWLKINQKSNQVSIFRISIIALSALFLFLYFRLGLTVYLWIALIAVAIFLVLIRWHDRIKYKKSLEKTLQEVNQNEITFLKGEDSPFENGEAHIEFNHPYSFDLDLFGHKSLFHHLNRTASFIGQKTLQRYLLQNVADKEIIDRQESILELSALIDWRQKLNALTILSADKKEAYDFLIHWSKNETPKLNIFVRILSFLCPLIFIGMVATLIWTADESLINWTIGIALINLGILGSQANIIKNELSSADYIDRVFLQYAIIIEHIESQNFNSTKLQALKNKLIKEEHLASKEIRNLANLFKHLDSINNGMVALVFNGSVLFHLHKYVELYQWKKRNAASIHSWIEVIGEFEALSSLANFKYNNNSYVFPKLNKSEIIEFKELGHPLISQVTRKCNDISFKDHKFVILTGSNMSGKSTFLRSLGVNLVLVKTGSVVCATAANVQPISLIASMRLADSLAEGESYFFAEVKRLQEIMLHLDQQKTFILLDEILRGTNSDDKQNGTIEVIKKMVDKKAIGVIATHDLEICKTTDEFPNYLSNKCFEVEIINNDLFFDYKLRPGVCKNKSATFLMKKMDVI